MSAVHDFATLLESAPEHDLEPGDTIEIVGYVWCGYYLAAVYRDDRGRIDTIRAAALRMEPHVALDTPPDLTVPALGLTRHPEVVG